MSGDDGGEEELRSGLYVCADAGRVSWWTMVRMCLWRKSRSSASVNKRNHPSHLTKRSVRPITSTSRKRSCIPPTEHLQTSSSQEYLLDCSDNCLLQQAQQQKSLKSTTPGSGATSPYSRPPIISRVNNNQRGISKSSRTSPGCPFPRSVVDLKQLQQ
jgi:hypothetical protein